MSYIVPLSDADSEGGAAIGGKAMALARLIRAGFAVPLSYCLTTRAYDDFAKQAQAQEAIRRFAGSSGVPRSTGRAIQQAFTITPMPPEVEGAILQAAGALFGAGATAVAVRSSALAEDQAEASYAGQHASFLCLRRGSDVLQAVRRCWTSLWSPEAIAYRSRLGQAPDQISMAVVIQTMLNPDYSGVLFTTNPITGDANQMIINAVRGLGEPLVSGTVTPHEWIINKQTGAVDVHRISDQVEMVTCGCDGTRTVRIPPDGTYEDIPSPQQIHQLCEIGTRLETLFGRPQDVEWAFCGGQLHLLQARPVTALPRVGVGNDEPANSPGYWSRLGFGEWFQTPVSPLFATLLLPKMNDATDTLVARKLGLRRATPSWSIIDGYYYVRGDFAITPSMLLAPYELVKNWRTSASDWVTDVLPQYMQALPELTSLSPESATTSVLIDHLEVVANTCADVWSWIIVTALCAKSSEAVFSSLCRLFLDRSGKLGTDLLSGFPNASVEADESLWMLAGDAGKIPDIQRVIETESSLEEVRQVAWSVAPHWATALEDWIARYGHRALDLDLAEPTLAEDSALIVHLLRAYFAPPSASPRMRHEETIARREVAEQMFRDRIESYSRPVRYLLRRSLELAVAHSRIRESRPFYLHMAWPVMRRDILEIGQRLASARVIEHADDVFFLTWDELRAQAQAILEPVAGGPSRVLDRIVRERCRNRIKAGGKIPPTHVHAPWPMRALMLMGERRRARTDVSAKPELFGTAGSPGKIDGIARVIAAPAQWNRFESGAVLVAPFTTPAWTALLSTASGVVTERGGSLCHAAIVAREYGIPAVVGVRNATTQVPDGTLIALNGCAGSVRLVRRPDE